MASRIKLAPPRVVARDNRKVKPLPKTGDPFYSSAPWLALMKTIIAERGRRCEDCGDRAGEGGIGLKIYGDHVQELRDGGAPLDPRNIRLRCARCHGRKSAQARAARAKATP